MPTPFFLGEPSPVNKTLWLSHLYDVELLIKNDKLHSKKRTNTSESWAINVTGPNKNMGTGDFFIDYLGHVLRIVSMEFRKL